MPAIRSGRITSGRLIGNGRENRAAGGVGDVKPLFVRRSEPLAADKGLITQKL